MISDVNIGVLYVRWRAGDLLRHMLRSFVLTMADRPEIDDQARTAPCTAPSLVVHVCPSAIGRARARDAALALHVPQAYFHDVLSGLQSQLHYGCVSGRDGFATKCCSFDPNATYAIHAAGIPYTSEKVTWFQTMKLWYVDEVWNMTAINASIAKLNISDKRLGQRPPSPLPPPSAPLPPPLPLPPLPPQQLVPSEVAASSIVPTASPPPPPSGTTPPGPVKFPPTPASAGHVGWAGRRRLGYAASCWGAALDWAVEFRERLGRAMGVVGQGGRRLGGAADGSERGADAGSRDLAGAVGRQQQRRQLARWRQQQRQ